MSDFKKLSDSKYEHVLNVWKKFETKTMNGYYDFYLQCDILLLGDIFEIFRNDSIKSCGLCPSHYLSAPVLNWDGIFNMTKTELEFIPDPDMCIFFEKDTRVGVPYIFRRYSKSSKKYLESYDAKQESK